MPLYTIPLLEKHVVAKDTLLCRFEKPSNFHFVPGQYGGFTLINPAKTDEKGNTRRFSILSTPDENTIAIATRIQSSAFKHNLNELAVGSTIKLAGPSGNFILHDDQSIPAVFIAGGMGIVPFHCMIQHALKHHEQRTLTLFYGNHSSETAPFLDELMLLANQHPNFSCIPVMSSDANWQGETGFITHTVMKKYIPDITVPLYYVCGGPIMVATLSETLVEMGIPLSRIKVEDFPGY